MGRGALVEVDELIDLGAGQPLGVIGALHERFKARPTGLMCGNEHVDVHNRQTKAL